MGTYEMQNVTSNWSERHSAYIAGLGTFCLSYSLISEKGCAGRYGTVVTDLDLEPSPDHCRQVEHQIAGLMRFLRVFAKVHMMKGDAAFGHPEVQRPHRGVEASGQVVATCVVTALNEGIHEMTPDEATAPSHQARGLLIYLRKNR
jgi:hypothetical protein